MPEYQDLLKQATNKVSEFKESISSHRKICFEIAKYIKDKFNEKIDSVPISFVYKDDLLDDNNQFDEPYISHLLNNTYYEVRKDVEVDDACHFNGNECGLWLYLPLESSDFSCFYFIAIGINRVIGVDNHGASDITYTVKVGGEQLLKIKNPSYQNPLNDNEDISSFQGGIKEYPDNLMSIIINNDIRRSNPKDLSDDTLLKMINKGSFLFY